MTTETGLDPVAALAVIGCLGVGAQWVAWRLKVPAIVLMLAAGILAGPVFGVLDPARDMGTLMAPMISIAVAVILFEGGLTLNRYSLHDAAFAVGDHWRACWVALVDARTALCGRVGMGVVDRFWWDHDRDRTNRHRAIVAPSQTGQTSRSAFAMGSDCNDPIGALAAVLAFEYVMVVNLATSFEHAMLSLAVGIVLALGLGAAGGYGLSASFRRGWVPEYMKVPVWSLLLLVFLLHRTWSCTKVAFWL